MRKNEDIIWKFPDLNYLSSDNITSHGGNTELFLKQEQIANLNFSLTQKEERITELTAKIEQLTKEINDVKSSNEKMFVSFQDAVQDLFKQVKNDGLNIVTKLTRLLINHELKTDHSIVKEILDQMLSKITDNSHIYVELSPSDFSVMREYPQNKPISIIENINLKPGNIVVKQQYTGFIYDIDDAINDILGT